MWQYLAIGGMFFLPAAAAVGARHGLANSRIVQPLWILALIIVIVFVGLRHNVGMDWNNYLIMLQRSQFSLDLVSRLTMTEPGYAFILIVGDSTGYGIYAANLISAVIVFGCIFYFAKRTPEPWLALVAAYPFFIMVFTMSANRQALAAATLMVVIANWPRLSLAARAVAIIGCSMFHYSALIFLIFLALDLRIDLVAKGIATALFTALAGYLLMQSGSAANYQENYVAGAESVESTGAVYHVLLNAVPASLYFLFPKFRSALFPTAILRNIAFAALASMPLAVILSTVASRLNFYWVPMTMYVLAALPGVVTPKLGGAVRIAIGAAMFVVAVLWLLFANSALAYLPYQNALTVPSMALDIS